MPPRAEAAKDKAEDSSPAQGDERETGFKPALVKDLKRESSDERPARKGNADSSNGDDTGERPGPWRSYKEILAKLAQRLLDAQRPIRILQALRWHPSTEEFFLKSKYKELPPIEYDPDLGFDPESKKTEISELLKDIERELGTRDELGRILRETTEEYLKVVQLLEARGTKRFYELSRKLYGSAKDVLPDGKTTVRAMGLSLYEPLTSIACERLGERQRRDIDAATAALVLNERLGRFFGETVVRAEVDDALVADAAAGSDYVKIRSGAMFSKSDLDILEVHEGWVHLATSLNGQSQPVARWLAKGPPRTTAVQEGLAATLEMLTFRSTPRRAKKLNDRVLAVDKAEDGASFFDIFEWYRTEGYDEDECFQNAMRIFRGGTVDGGVPFTKDACYCRGIVLNQAFMLAAILHDRSELIPFLFVGKVAHQDIPILHAHVSDGIVRPPPFLPHIFEDMNGLAVWLSYSSFFSTLCKASIVEHYASSMRRV
ncbi:MAG: flavohemoglobin expression-modulating QEGLA motif protein [Polyangiaceae bacterium]